MVLSGLQNGSPAVALLVHAEMQVISEEVLVSLNCSEKQGCLWGCGRVGCCMSSHGNPIPGGYVVWAASLLPSGLNE